MSKSSAPTKDYVLGQSDSEQDRLAAQHELIWRETGSSSAFMAPVKNPKKLTAICDLGCGTGAWLNRAAGEAENAVLFGFDLSAAKFAPAWADPSVNGGRIVLGTKDALQPWPPALQGRFDVINCLFFALWLPRDTWATLIANIKTLLKPGGWVQILDPLFEPGPAIWSGGSDHAEGAAVWDACIRQYMKSPSTSFGEIKHMPDRLAEGGFAAVGERKMTMKLGQAQPDEKLRSVSKTILLPNVIKGREAGVCAIPGTPMGEGRVFPEKENTQEWNGLVEKLEKAFEAGSEIPCMAVWAKKPKTFMDTLSGA